MSNERIDLKHYENKYTFETPIDPNWNGAPWTTADLKVILDELKKYYGFVDELLTYFHHTQLENEPFLDLMYRMGVFEEE